MVGNVPLRTMRAASSSVGRSAEWNWLLLGRRQDFAEEPQVSMVLAGCIYRRELEVVEKADRMPVSVVATLWNWRRKHRACKRVTQHVVALNVGLLPGCCVGSSFSLWLH
jgi:hypothetical protein